ncbi:MAG: GatB/YqeY domain-containing protein [Armatimonadetes bacterium]|nr:GatB/YqeY domain-containing protein [Armatimonadota bacterium]
MALDDRLLSDYNQALRAGDQVRVSTLRLLRAALKDTTIERRAALTEAEELQVVAKQAKQRRDSAEAYRAAGRMDLAEREVAEQAILETYLPAALSEPELHALVTEVIAEVGAAGPQDMGKVMRVLMPRIKGRADGGAVNAMVKALLG